MIDAHRASPYELVFEELSGLSRGSGLFLAGCLFVLVFLAGPAFAAPNQPSETNPPGCAVVNKAPAKAKPKVQALSKAKPPAQAPLKGKTTASKAKPKSGTKAAVAAKTVAKAQAITAEISPALPDNLENEISKFFGISYRLGGEGPAGIDCSALVKKVYSDVFGISLPRSSSEQSRLGNLDNVARDELKTGDLIFFGQNRKRVNHVGMYLAGGHFLHAARSEGVTISKLDESYWKSRFMFSKRIRGLETVEEPDDVMGFEKDLARDSASFAFSDFGAGGLLSSLEAGVRVHDSLELALSGFFQKTLSDSDPSADSLTAVSSMLPDSKESESGFRLAAILSPAEWFKFTPSVTKIDSAGEHSGRERDQRQKIGLESWMVLPSTQMAVFMGAHANNQENLLQNPTAVSPDWQTLNFAMGLHYTLSDSMRLSLWGTHAYTTDAKPGDDPVRRSSMLEDVAIQLDVKF
ncbi:MAG: C40 family peptidase [Deltaproteobacteria bacterium]|nr:C40 family peptidase [Deltaproteobacteria bacterium]